jgi:hypothetical protein
MIIFNNFTAIWGFLDKIQSLHLADTIVVLPHMLCLCITEYKIGKMELQLTELLNLTDVEVEYYQNL